MIQLLWSTWSDVCDFIGPFTNGTVGKHLDGLGKSFNKIGLYYNNNGEEFLIQEGDWIFKDEFGKISYLTDKEFNRLKIIDQYIDNE